MLVTLSIWWQACQLIIHICSYMLPTLNVCCVVNPTCNKSSLEHIPCVHAASYVYPALTCMSYLLEHASMLMIFTDIMLWTCAHEQIAHGLQLIGVANKTPYLWHSWASPIDSKHSEASLSPISTDSSYLWVTQMPRCGELAIFYNTLLVEEYCRKVETSGGFLLSKVYLWCSIMFGQNDTTNVQNTVWYDQLCSSLTRRWRWWPR